MQFGSRRMRRRTGMGRLIPPLVIFIACSMTLRWTHVLISFSHQNSEVHNLSPLQNALINTAVANKHKQQSSNIHILNNEQDKKEDEHNNLRASPRTLTELNLLNETAPTSTLISVKVTTPSEGYAEHRQVFSYTTYGTVYFLPSWQRTICCDVCPVAVFV